MKRITSLAALCAALALVPVAGASAAPIPSVVYDAVPSPLPPNVVSLGYEATSTSEFGDLVHLRGTDRVLRSVTVTMSDWALRSDYPALPATGWTHPITVNVYAPTLGENGVPTTRLATTTQPVAIPWRPPADPTCPGGTGWRAGDGQCYNGIAFTATFDMSAAAVTLQDDVIVGVAYNTQHYGAAPIREPGPYNSLNVGVPTGQVASVGLDADADAVFWRTSFAGFYTDAGASGVGTFRTDTGWAPNGTVAMRISAAPPTVGPPTSKKQCKKGGWRIFNNPSFRSQGACIRFVAGGGHHGEGHGRVDDDRAEDGPHASSGSSQGEERSGKDHDRDGKGSRSGKPWDRR